MSGEVFKILTLFLSNCELIENCTINGAKTRLAKRPTEFFGSLYTQPLIVMAN